MKKKIVAAIVEAAKRGHLMAESPKSIRVIFDVYTRIWVQVCVCEYKPKRNAGKSNLIRYRC